MGDTTVVAGRLSVLRQIIARLDQDPALSNVTIWPGWPGEQDVTDEMLWSGELAGDTDVPVMTGEGTRHPRSDEWTIDWYGRVAGVTGASTLDAVRRTHDRIGVIAGAVENLPAENPTVDDEPTLIDAVLTSAEHSVEVTPNGPIGILHLVLSCESRLT